MTTEMQGVPLEIAIFYFHYIISIYLFGSSNMTLDTKNRYLYCTIIIVVYCVSVAFEHPLDIDLPARPCGAVLAAACYREPWQWG